MYRIHFDADNGTPRGWVLTFSTPKGQRTEPVGALRKRTPHRLGGYPPRSVLAEARVIARVHGVELPPRSSWVRMSGGWRFGADV